MECSRTILLFYSFLGIFIAGGVFFKKKDLAHVFLALFLLFFAFEQFNFLYVTGSLFINYPSFYYWGFPVCLLLGPLFYLHLILFKTLKKPNKGKIVLHFIPFILYLFYTIYLISIPYDARIKHVIIDYKEEVILLNYLKAIHVSLYGVLSVSFLKSQTTNWVKADRRYVTAMIGVYVLSAILLSYLTVFESRYKTFSAYFFLVSTFILMVGYVL